MITLLPNKHCKAVEEEDDHRTRGKEIRRKKCGQLRTSSNIALSLSSFIIQMTNRNCRYDKKEE